MYICIEDMITKNDSLYLILDLNQSLLYTQAK